ncbi:hypothetical protein K2173_002358 [Erythroxylum novogranatense]|uniref:Uncharacterized protein n=1 Tax=Erythroxylum novogranatense TaxID=1862640 RepID=A0AAV8TB36_9ROSI|nr:hypothetical protein K2173_002358 [Erythroxylum novogranatense]
MFNSEQQIFSTSSMDPRISFSNDFVENQQATKYESSYREAPVSGDFEFSFRNNAMIPADEIFSEGVMLPLKDDCSRKMTLREELLIDDAFEDSLPRLPRNSGWWKERLGFRRSQVIPKRTQRNNGVLERVVEDKRSSFVHEKTQVVAETVECNGSCRGKGNGGIVFILSLN